MRAALADFLPIAAQLFIAMIGMGMLVPILPTLIPDGAAGAASAGLLLSMLGVARLLADVPAGLLADRVGVRPTMTVGLGILAAGGLLAGSAPGFALLLLAILLQGMGGAFFSTAAITALVERAGPTRRGAAMSWFQGSMLLALSAGPPIGGVIAERVASHAPFLVQAALAALALLAVALARPSGAPRPAAARASATALLGNVPLLAAGVMGFAGFFARTAAGWSLVPLLGPQRFAMDAEEVGLMLGLGTAVNFAVLPAVAHATDRWGARTALLVATWVTLVAILLLALVTEPWGLWAGTVLVMVGSGAMLPAAGALVLGAAAGMGTGAATALFRTLGDVGIALGPVGSTTIASLAGLPIAGGLWVTAGVVAAATGLFLAAEACAARSRRRVRS
jgi:MFS family permease